LVYDSDAQKYFTAVETAGGSFDLSGIDPTYTESYVKTAHSNFYAGLKTDGLWNKLTEFYLLAGKTFGGLTVKGKGSGSITNNNFVSGDYQATGSGAGLTGDGSSKYIICNLAPPSNPDDLHCGHYMTANATGNIVSLDGGTAGSNADFQLRDADAVFPASSVNLTSLWTLEPCYPIASRRGVNDVEVYQNGVSRATDTTTATASISDVASWQLFAIEGASLSAATLTFAHIGTGLTDTEASNLSTRVNTLMTSLGCNVY